jgi:hypothetical protein
MSNSFLLFTQFSGQSQFARLQNILDGNKFHLDGNKPFLNGNKFCLDGNKKFLEGTYFHL